MHTTVFADHPRLFAAMSLLRLHVLAFLFGGWLLSGGVCAQVPGVPLLAYLASERSEPCREILLALLDAAERGKDRSVWQRVERANREIARRTDIPVRQRSTALTALAQALIRQGQREEAFVPLREANELAETLPPEDPMRSYAQAAYGAYLVYYQAPELALAPLLGALDGLGGADTLPNFPHRELYQLLQATAVKVNEREVIRETSEQMLRIARRTVDSSLLAQLYNNTGWEHNLAGMHEEAIALYRQGLHLLVPDNALDSFHFANILESMAHPLVAVGRRGEAYENLVAALELRLPLDCYGHVIQAMAYYLNYCLEAGDMERAQSFLRIYGSHIRDEPGENGRTYRIYQPAAEIYRRLGQAEVAERYQRMHDRYVAQVVYPQERERTTPSELNSYIHFRNKEQRRQNYVEHLETERLKEKARLNGWIALLATVLLGLALFLGYYYRRTQLARETERQRLLELRNENLRFSLEAKERDLERLAADNRLRTEIKRDLLRRIRQFRVESHEDVARQLTRLSNELESTVENQSNQDLLQDRVEEINSQFEAKLRDRIPDITVQEVKVCQLLKLGMNNQQIAEVLNRSDVTVRSYRYRIRKKAGLPAKGQLIRFLHEL